jgi:microcystin-dependent protein
MYRIRNYLRARLIIGAMPNNIQNGQVEDAVIVMANLNWIVNQVNANAQAAGLAALLSVANTFTSVQSGVAATSAANFTIASQVQNRVFNTLSSTLGTNTITGRNATLPLSAYAVGQIFSFSPSQKNTSSATYAIDGLGSALLKSGGQPLVGQELGSATAIVAVASTVGMPVMDLLNSQRLFPAGIILDFAGPTAPDGFVLCDGASYTTAAKPALFAAIGYTWGGSGVNFNVPDLRGFVTAGRDDMGGTAAGRITVGVAGFVGTTLGATGGDQRAQLHSHSGTDSGHGHGVTDPGHTHVQINGSGYNGSTGHTSNGYVDESNGGNITNMTSNSSVSNITVNSGASVITIGNSGAGGSQNVQPTAIVNKIIKT